MPVKLPSGLFNAYTEVLDSSPTANRYAQLQARKQAEERAKNDAFDSHIREMNTKINAAGHRTVDNDAFDYKVSKWKNFEMQNRGKTDINTRTEADRLYREALNLTNESKDAEKTIAPLNTNLADPSKRDLYSADIIPAIDSHNQPLYVKDSKTGEYVRNEKRTPINLNDDKLFGNDVDISKKFGEWTKGMPMGKIIGNIVSRDKIAGKVTKEYTQGFSPKQEEQLGLNAAVDVEKDRKLKRHYDKKLKDISEDDYAKMNEVFQSAYGATVEHKLPNGQKIKENNYIQSAEDLAAAEAILQARNSAEKGTFEEPDKDLAFQRAQINIFNNNGSSGDLRDFDIFGKYNGKVTQKTITVPTKDGKQETIVRDIIPATSIETHDKEFFNANGIRVNPYPGSRGQPDYYVVQDENTWLGDGGQVIDRTEVAQAKMDKVGKKKNWGNGQPPTPKPSNSTYTIKGKKYSEAELFKMGYTLDQISQYKNK